MSAVIKVEGLSKVYQVTKRSATLIDELATSLKLKNVEKSQEIRALEDVSFEIQPGEVVGIIGRNGSGKSTLLKILSRVIEPSKGSFRLKGRLASLLEVGVGFHPNLTGRENIFLCGAISGLTHKQIVQRFDEIVDFSELEQFLDMPVRHYSSGMVVRLGFSVAAHMDQQIIIIDEALAVGDIAFQRKCWQRLNIIASAGATVLFVSHNTTLISNCNKVLYLQAGRIRDMGDSNRVIDTYMADTIGQQSERFERARLLSHLFQEKAREVAIKRIERIQSQSQSSTIIPDGKIEYTIDIEPLITANNLRLILRLYNSHGFCLAMSYSSEPFSVIAGQNLQMDFSIQNVTLSAGHYNVSFALVSADKADVEYDHIRLESSIVVESLTHHISHCLAEQLDSGCLILPSEVGMRQMKIRG